MWEIARALDHAGELRIQWLIEVKILEVLRAVLVDPQHHRKVARNERGARENNAPTYVEGGRWILLCVWGGGGVCGAVVFYLRVSLCSCHRAEWPRLSRIKPR